MTDAAGVEIFRRRYALKPGAVGCGRPVIKCSGVAVDYSETSAMWSNAVPDAVLPKTDAPAEVPPYVTPRSVTAAAAGERLAATGFFRTDRDADGRWRFVDPNGCPFFLAAALTVSHQGDHNAQLGYAPYGRNVLKKFNGQPTPIPPTLWRPWQSGAWLCDGGELVLALATPRASGMSIHFWDDPKRDSLHADAQYYFERKSVPQGGACAVEGRPFVAGAAVSGGLAAWTKVFADIRNW